jgi:hypothetical protein
VSIHFNASPSHSVTGCQSFYFTPSPSSRLVAESIEQAMGEDLGSRTRGVTGNDFAVLWRANNLAVLIECAFLSNKAEAARSATPEGQQKIAEALAAGLLRVKPVISNDPPEAELARCEIYAKRYNIEMRKIELATKKAEPKRLVYSSGGGKSSENGKPRSRKKKKSNGV